MVQDTDEWVLLLAGEAGLRLEDGPAIALRPGDHVFIPAGVAHGVKHTSRSPPAVWLALHTGLPPRVGRGRVRRLRLGERRGGGEGVSAWRCLGGPDHAKTKNKI